jgi:hypothetical protein
LWSMPSKRTIVTSAEQYGTKFAAPAEKHMLWVFKKT